MWGTYKSVLIHICFESWQYLFPTLYSMRPSWYFERNNHGITFLPRSKRLLISWLQSPSAVILEPPKNKVWHCFHCFPIYFPWSGGTRCMILVFWVLSFKPTFSLSSFTCIKRLFSFSSHLGKCQWKYVHRYTIYIVLIY